jgi:NADH:ubiquinone oxidoreductase subunit 2 (subunit N)
VIEPPLWLVILPIAATPLVYLTRRWGIGAHLAALVALLAGLLVWSLPPTNLISLLGRPFLLDTLTQYALALIFVTTASLFLAAWRLPQGWSFFPLGLVLLGLFAVVGMSRHLGITALVATLAAVGMAIIIQGGQAGSTRAAWRFLLMMFLALPFFLLAAWRVDLFREDAKNVIYLGQAAFLLGAGMTIWLAAVPMHGWLTAVGAQAPPVVAAFVLTAFPLLALVTLLHTLTEATWFVWLAQAGDLLLLAGLISAAAGGVLAAVQRGLRPLLGYAALFDLGCLLVALATQAGGMAFYAGLATRALGLALTGAATATIGLAVEDDSLAGLRGAARHMPLATAALAAGGFSLAGLPLTAGFLPRWLLFGGLAQADPRWVWLLVAAGVGVALGYLRSLNAMLASPVETTDRAASPRPDRVATAILVALGLLTLALGLFPQPLLQAAQHLAALYPLPLF